MPAHVFGPVLSRRFGLSLGVDLVGQGVKKCNFDCLYCELPKSQKVSSLSEYASVGEIVAEVKDALTKHKDIDFITLTANGEPTLYPKLSELIDELNTIKGGKKLLIPSNGSTIVDANMRKTLAKIDVVKLSLDSARVESFKKIDRPVVVNPSELIDAMSGFRKEYDGVLVLETLFVKGVNDDDADIKALNEAYMLIAPDRIDLSTIDRPPAYAVESISEERLREIAGTLDKSLKISIATRKHDGKKTRAFSESEISNALKNRPFSALDIESLFDEESKKIFENMHHRGVLKEQSVAGVTFYWAV
jgi:wyosine [tRNA(Phe)-imidazoG37] synthetase (radical SAM superfamily)